MSASPPTALLSLDFDGTLVLDDAPPLPIGEIDRILHDWQQAGGQWLVNTGRTLPHTLHGLVDIRTRHLPTYIIAREQEIYTRNRFGRWVDFGVWNEEGRAARARLFRKSRRLLKEVRKFVERETMASFFDMADEPPGIIASNLEEMDRLCTFLSEPLSEYPDLSYERNSIYLRFSHRAFSKGSSFAWLAGELGVPPSRRGAIGDHFNDLSMLRPEVASWIGCPGNAVPEVREQVLAFGGNIARDPGPRGTIALVRHWLGELKTRVDVLKLSQ